MHVEIVLQLPEISSINLSKHSTKQFRIFAQGTFFKELFRKNISLSCDCHSHVHVDRSEEESIPLVPSNGWLNNST